MPGGDKSHSQIRVMVRRVLVMMIARGFEKVQVRVVLQTLQAATVKCAQRPLVRASPLLIL